MNDTSPEMEQRFRTMLLARSGEERMKMGCSMHTFAQQLVRASVEAQTPNISPAALRRALFLRFYGSDFNEAAREKILRVLEKAKPKAGYSSSI